MTLIPDGKLNGTAAYLTEDGTIFISSALRSVRIGHDSRLTYQRWWTACEVARGMQTIVSARTLAKLKERLAKTIAAKAA